LKLKKIEKPAFRGKKIQYDKEIEMEKKCGNKNGVIIMLHFNKEIRPRI